MVEARGQLGFRERTEREVISDMWTSFFEREYPEVKPDNIPTIVERVLDLMGNIDDFRERNKQMLEIYKEFGIKVRNNEMHLDQESLT